MHDYDVFSVESKAEVLSKSREFWNPGKTDFWSESGIDLVIDRREGYFIWDMSGLRLIDVHLNGGAEAIDIALKTARHATQRRKIVSIIKAYHGHTGLAVATGDDRLARIFLSDRPDEFSQVPFNDLAAMEAALAGGDAGAGVTGTIPATDGRPLPGPGY